VSRVPTHAVGGKGEPTLLLLHGLGGGCMVWEGTMDRFSRTHRTAAWTMPGYPGSPPLPEMTWLGLTDAAVALLDLLEVERSVVVGHSMGGMVAQEMALRRADRVAGLVLVGTAAVFGGGSPEFVERYLADRLAPLDAGHTPADFAPATIDSLVAAPLSAADRDLAVGAMAAISADAYRQAVTCLTTWDRRDRLGDIAAPTLVIVGDSDPIAPPKVSQALVDGIPDAEMAVLPGVGHLVNMEAPDAFHDTVERWLADRIGRS
jgi:pimeloyl-ACP methyl ester carboxylesterase